MEKTKQAIDALAAISERNAELMQAMYEAYEAKREQCIALKSLLKKIYDRSNPSTFEDAGNTRLDPDLLDEIEILLDLHGNDPTEIKA